MAVSVVYRELKMVVTFDWKTNHGVSVDYRVLKMTVSADLRAIKMVVSGDWNTKLETSVD